MKTIKPAKLGLLHRTFEDEGTAYLVVTVLAHFSFGDVPALHSEVDLWKLAAAELGQNAPLDLVMPKRRGELLLTAKACARGGVPVPAMPVRAQLGGIEKTLWIAGDRQWTRGGTTEPQPFVEMPITWERAFGGVGFAPNPVGKGTAGVKGEGGEAWPLPNVEDPKRLVQSPQDRPPPAGFAAVDLTAPQRWSKIGTYDERWLRERFPGFAADTDLALFNAAPEDQQIDGFFRGDESFLLEGMHPDRPVIEACLPGIAARAFLNRKAGEGEVFAEVPLHLDTVHLFPHVERGVLVYRGLAVVAEDDARDVLQIVIGGEALGEPRPVEHYQEVLRRRVDPKNGHLFMLCDGELMPPGPAGVREKNEVEKLIESEDLLRRHMQAGARRRTEENRQQTFARLTALGLDPAKFGVSPEPAPEVAEEPLPDLEALAPFVERLEARADRLTAEAEQKKAQAEADARTAFEKAGMDPDKLAAEGRDKVAGPPRVSPQAERQKLVDLAAQLRDAGRPHADLEAKLADPGFTRRLDTMAEVAAEGYREFAHRVGAAPRLTGEAASKLREEVRAAHRHGQSLAGRDLTGADLSGLELQGADFSGAMLESASFAGADLRGARFERAVLARADLTNAKLGGAMLREANLGLAVLAGADLSGADLMWAVLYQADLAGASFREASLSFADLSEATLCATDFSGATAQLLTLVRADLSGVTLAGADLSRSTFLECTLAGVDLSGARLISATFVSVQGRGAILRGANLENARMVKDCGLDEADLRGATLTGANLRGTSLAGADLTAAQMNGIDLSECNLRGAKLDATAAQEARFVRADLSGASLRHADLMLALLHKARVDGADFFQANLFRADLAKVTGDERTSFAQANVAQARVVRATAAEGTHG
jgi:uncharacterized protein YjbI with pentapeptide repeats